MIVLGFSYFTQLYSFATLRPEQVRSDQTALKRLLGPAKATEGLSRTRTLLKAGRGPK